MIPDPEIVLGDYLRSLTAVQNAIGAGLVGRVANKTPQDISQPWVRITLLDDTQVGPLHFTRNFMQVDCYAGTDNDPAVASLLARTIRHALEDVTDTRQDTAVVTFATSSMRRIPDDSVEPARERYIVSVEMGLHAWPE